LGEKESWRSSFLSFWVMLWALLPLYSFELFFACFFVDIVFAPATRRSSNE